MRRMAKVIASAAAVASTHPTPIAGEKRAAATVVAAVALVNATTPAVAPPIMVVRHQVGRVLLGYCIKSGGKAVYVQWLPL
jgi:hypothetical protein